MFSFLNYFKCKWTIRMKMSKMRDFELCFCVCVCKLLHYFCFSFTKCGWLNFELCRRMFKEIHETFKLNQWNIAIKAWSRCKTCQNISYSFIWKCFLGRFVVYVCLILRLICTKWHFNYVEFLTMYKKKIANCNTILTNAIPKS